MEKYKNACIEIDEIHKLDKTIEIEDGVSYPSELLYSKRLVAKLESYVKGASEQLKLAARCQHLKRWEIPRNTYPMDKVGYLKWRKALYLYQSEEAARVLQNVGYSVDFINEVKVIIQKKDITKNIDTQIIEDIACLVFLEFYLEDFSKKHSGDKLKSIIAKTWAKMSANAKAEALKIKLPGHLEATVLEAIKS